VNILVGPRLRASAAAAAVLLLTIGSGQSAASAPDVECGQVAAWTAPDPAGPTDGSLTMGVSSTWDVLATATISPAAAADLPNGGNSGPTCLVLGLDGTGKVTSIDFAAQGTLTGTVAYDSGSGYFTFASRLIIPKTITDAYPALGALFDSSYQAGSTLAITFFIDTTSGGFTGFNGHAAFCGKGSINAQNVGKVGNATIPAGALGAAARKALHKLSGQAVCARIHTTGTIDPQSGNIATAAAVVVSLDPGGPRATPPATTTSEASVPPAGGSTPDVIWLVLAFGLTVAVAGALGRRSRER
jgi:hypothetical protein